MFRRIIQISISVVLLAILAVVVLTTHSSTADYPETLDTHLQSISREPHPAGSAAHDEVRDYILEHVPSEYQVEVQTFNEAGIEFENIFAYLDRGFDSTRMVSVHYDSVPISFGAGDAGTAVASALTLLPEWQEAELSTNLLVAFVDGEEGYLVLDGEAIDTPAEEVELDRFFESASLEQLEHYYKHTQREEGIFTGSRYFVDTYNGRYGEIEYLFNFEARGTGGRLILFEALNVPARTVALWSRLLETLTFSATEIVYGEAGGLEVTDVFEYQRLAGTKILNFAFIGEVENYHTPQDTFDQVDEVSKSSTYLAMSRVVTTQIEDSATSVVYYSIGPWVLVLSRYLVYVLSIVSGLYLSWQMIKRRASRWLILPILVLCSVVWLELMLLPVIGAILFALVYRYRALRKIYPIGQYWFLCIVILHYTFLATLVTLAGVFSGY